MGSNGSLVLMFAFGMFLLPSLLVLCSSNVRGFEKTGWTLVSFFLSWVGFAVFMIVISTRANHADSR